MGQYNAGMHSEGREIRVASKFDWAKICLYAKISNMLLGFLVPRLILFWKYFLLPTFDNF